MTKPFLSADHRMDFIFGEVSENMARTSIARWDNRAQRICRDTLIDLEHTPEETENLMRLFLAVQRAQRQMVDSATMTAGTLVERTLQYSKLHEARQAAMIAALRYITPHELLMDAPLALEFYDEETIGEIVEQRMFFDNLYLLLIDQLQIPDCDFDVQRASEGSPDAA